MHEGGDQEASAIITAFLLRYMEDQRGGAPASLATYQALFPGFEELIAREYARFVDETSGLASFSPASTPPAAAVGHPDRIGPYRILEPLGEGGMGVVYAAEQTEQIRRRVAIKVIKLGMDTREVLARFESERQALALMNHPHIARVLDAGTTEQGRPYFVMELVRGIPLSRFCDSQRLKTEERLRIFLQVCAAVQHAHQKGVIHRDLKPSNILVSFEEGRPSAKIIDFGVAKSTDHRLTEKTVYTEQGQIIGTPEYMSPEQAEMGALDIDTRTDIYSLGVILYELLVGVLPIESSSLRKGSYADIQRRIVQVEPPPPSSRLDQAMLDAARNRGSDLRALKRRVRGDLDWITLKAMEKNRDRRYPSASELAADVERFLLGEVVLAGPPRLSYRLRKLVRRHRRMLAASLAALVLAIAAAGISLHFARQAAQRSRERSASGLHTAALNDWREQTSLEGEVERLEGEWKVAVETPEGWAPVWERGKEIAAWHKLEDARTRIGLHYNQAVSGLYRALGQALPGSPLYQDIQADLEKLFLERYRAARKWGEESVHPDFYKGLLDSLGRGTYLLETEGGGKVSLQSDPPGADVHGFVYQNLEERLVPLPLQLGPPGESDNGVRQGKPFLEVERVWSEEGHPFRAGDRWLSVDGKEVGLWGDVARALKEVREGQQVSVAVLRDGGTISLSWTPFPAQGAKPAGTAWAQKLAGMRLATGRVVSFYDQFGFTFAGYPLDLSPASRIGRTEEKKALDLRLPRGSYLFVLMKDGYRAARYPVVIPTEEGTVEVVKLLRDADIPPGLVYIPGGPSFSGGDRKVDQSLPPGRRQVGGFFLGRLEVTVRQYLEFLNDPEVSGRIDLERGVFRGTEIPAMPGENDPSSGRYFLHAPDGAWQINPKRIDDPDWPILGISINEAREYAAWLTRREGGRWTFRLPTDLEWEKAARGVDRRAYVWGNYAIWSFASSYKKGGFLRRRPAVAGTHPADESIFGIRDMAGSVMEPTSDQTIPGFNSVRGGSWSEPTDYYYRIANRLGVRDTARGSAHGLRLAADLPGR